MTVRKNTQIRSTEERNRLVLDNQLLAFSVARRFCGMGVSLQDLRQVALLGMLYAAETFEPSRARFSTHAVVVMRRLLSRAIDEQGHFIRRPRNACLATKKLSRTLRRVRRETGMDITAWEAAARLGMSRRVAQWVVDSYAAGGVAVRPITEGIDESAERDDPIGEARGLVVDLLSRLPKEDAEIMRQHYGIDCEPSTLRAIGARLGMAPRTANDRKLRALKRLRSMANA